MQLVTIQTTGAVNAQLAPSELIHQTWALAGVHIAIQDTPLQTLHQQLAPTVVSRPNPGFLRSQTTIIVNFGGWVGELQMRK